MKRILFVYFGRKVGDTIISTGFFRALKSAYPDCHIDVCIPADYAFILQNNTDITSVFPIYKTYLGWGKILLQLRRYKYDVLILQRVFSTRKQNFFFSLFQTRRIERLANKPGQHLSEDYMDLLERLGIRPAVYPNYLLTIPVAVQEKVKAFLAEHKLTSRFLVVLNPLGAEKSRSLTKQKIQEILSMLYTLNVPVILLDYKRKYASLSHLAYLFQSSDLFETAAILSHAGVVISTDTGIVHLADMFQKNIIDIFSAQNDAGDWIDADHVRRWQPRTAGRESLSLLGNPDVNAIAVEDIKNAVLKLIN